MLSEAGPADADACVALWLDALEARDGHPAVDGTAERCRDKLAAPAVVWLVARDDVGVCGFVLASTAGSGSAFDPPDAAYLSLLGVAPRAQGRRLGARLLAAATARLGAAGYEQAVLHVMIENAAAVGLYRGAGWREIGERRAHPLNGALTGTFVVDL